MEYERLSTNRVDMFRYDQSPPPQNIIANIIIVDKAHDGLFPIAYQFLHDVDYNDQALMNTKIASLHITDDTFMQVGDVDLINKNDRSILMRSGGMIHYKHLITIPHKNGKRLDSFSKKEEFTSALITLIDALRTQKSITSEMRPSEKHLKLSAHVKSTNSAAIETDPSTSSSNVHRIFYSHLANDPFGTLAVFHGPLGQRLYELQI